MTFNLEEAKKEILEILLPEWDAGDKSICRCGICMKRAQVRFNALASKGVYVGVDATRICADEDGCPREYKTKKTIPLSELMKEQEG